MMMQLFYDTHDTQTMKYDMTSGEACVYFGDM